MLEKTGEFKRGQHNGSADSIVPPTLFPHLCLSVCICVVCCMRVTALSLTVCPAQLAVSVSSQSTVLSLLFAMSFLHPTLLSSATFSLSLHLSHSVSGISVLVQHVSLMVMGLIGNQGCWKDRE